MKSCAIPPALIDAGVVMFSPYIENLTPQLFMEMLTDRKEAKSEKLLTISETAKLLGLSKATIYRMLNTGVLEKIQISRKAVRISPESVRALQKK